MKLDTLTEYEKLIKFSGANLSDGHAHQGQTPGQQTIIDKLSQIFFMSENDYISNIEEKFKEAFFRVARQDSQTIPSNLLKTLICHSASSACEIVANYLRLKQLSVTLIEPTFDNIPNILKRHAVPLVSLDERLLSEDSIDVLLNNIQTDAIFLVCPNNPTGHLLSKQVWEIIIRYCARTQKLLIVDVAFRLFAPTMFWDQYSMLNENEIDYLLIEDTGKIWPTLDLKVGLLTPSERILLDINRIHDDYLLNVSPFILNLLTEYVYDTQANGFQASIWDINEQNRKELYKAIEGTILKPCDQLLTINIAWLEINSKYCTGEEFYHKLVLRNVHILPGLKFYWNTPQLGTNYVRVALNRSAHVFREAALIIREVALEYMKT